MDERQKNQLDAWLEAGKGGYTTEELETAFEEVQNKEHWKMDINAIIPAEKRRLMTFAIPWFTGGGQVEFEELPDGKLRVTAPGYWSNGMEG